MMDVWGEEAERNAHRLTLLNDQGSPVSPSSSEGVEVVSTQALASCRVKDAKPPRTWLLRGHTEHRLVEGEDQLAGSGTLRTHIAPLCAG